MHPAFLTRASNNVRKYVFVKYKWPRFYSLLGGLDLLLGAQLGGIELEEVIRLGGVLTGNVMEGGSGDVVGLSLAYQAIVLEEILLLRDIRVGLSLQDTLGLTPVCGVSTG
jgi:hypothetical protein